MLVMDFTIFFIPQFFLRLFNLPPNSCGISHKCVAAHRLNIAGLEQQKNVALKMLVSLTEVADLQVPTPILVRIT
jgi:hypothetical protein